MAAAQVLAGLDVDNLRLSAADDGQLNDGSLRINPPPYTPSAMIDCDDIAI
jgi:hypothetical protein